MCGCAIPARERDEVATTTTTGVHVHIKGGRQVYNFDHFSGYK